MMTLVTKTVQRSDTPPMIYAAGSNAVENIRNGREGMYWANDMLVQLSIVRNQANTFAVTFGHKKKQESTNLWARRKG